MEIIHLLKSTGLGGIQSLISDQVKFFNKEFTNINHTLFTKNKSSLIPNTNSLYGIKGVLTLFFKAWNKTVIFHSYNNIGSLKFLILFFVIRPRSLIFHERGNAWNVKLQHGYIVRKNASLAKIIICNSNASKLILNKKFKIPKKKLKVIYNGIDVNRYKKNKNKAINKKKLFRILYVGRIESNKGLHTLLIALSHLKKFPIELNILGNGSLFEINKKLAVNLDLKNINFLGIKKNVSYYYQKSHLLIVPSIREPFGNVIVEAALHETPVLATEVDGITEIIDNSNFGYLIKPTIDLNYNYLNETVPLPEYVVRNNRLQKPKENDPRIIAKKILLILKNYSKAKDKSLNLKNKCITNYSLSLYVNALVDVYKKSIKDE